MQPAITGKRSDLYNLVDKAHGGKPHEIILAARLSRSGRIAFGIAKAGIQRVGAV